MTNLVGLLYETDRKVGGHCSIEGMNIISADLDTGNYSGQIRCTDSIEDIGWTENWEALEDPDHIQELFGRSYGILIRPKDKNILTGNYGFTLLPEFNKMMGHYIAHGILDYNPELPSLDRKPD